MSQQPVSTSEGSGSNRHGGDPNTTVAASSDSADQSAKREREESPETEANKRRRHGTTFDYTARENWGILDTHGGMSRTAAAYRHAFSVYSKLSCNPPTIGGRNEPAFDERRAEGRSYVELGVGYYNDRSDLQVVAADRIIRDFRDYFTHLCDQLLQVRELRRAATEAAEEGEEEEGGEEETALEEGEEQEDESEEESEEEQPGAGEM